MKKFRFFLKLMAATAACFVLCGIFAACSSDSINGEESYGSDGSHEPDGPKIYGDVGPRVNDAADPPNGIYVSTSGNDATATGAIDKPYKSINAALAAASPGDTIILRGGTYREGAATEVRVRQPNITIKSAKGEWAHIDLPFPANLKDENDGNSAIHFDPEASGCKLQSIEVTGGFYTVCMESKWDWHGDDDEVAASNITIEDCMLHESRFDAVKIKPNCDNITIRYNDIYNSGRAFIGDSDFDQGECNAEGIDNVNGSGMYAHHNYIHDICSNAIYAKGGARDAVIKYNRIERTYGAGIMLGFDTSPQYFDTAVNPDYYENIRGTVSNNLIINTGWEGIGLYASQDAEVYNNTVVNTVGYGRGLYHSPVYFGVATQDWDNPDGCPPNINPYIHHNIVSQPSTYNNRMIDIRNATGVYAFDLSGLDGHPTMDNNCYYVAGKSAKFSDNRPPAKENMGFSEWQTHIGEDSSSVEVNPELNSDYLPGNASCTGMGIESPLNPY